jgi:hypothetical protein
MTRLATSFESRETRVVDAKSARRSKAIKCQPVLIRERTDAIQKRPELVTAARSAGLEVLQRPLVHLGLKTRPSRRYHPYGQLALLRQDREREERCIAFHFQKQMCIGRQQGATKVKQASCKTCDLPVNIKVIQSCSLCVCTGANSHSMCKRNPFDTILPLPISSGEIVLS